MTHLESPQHHSRESAVAPASGAATGKIAIQTQFSAGFGNWLIRHRVGLVCSTYQTGHLLFLGARSDGLPVPSAAGFSRAMGLAAFSQRVYVGTKAEIWRLENVLRADEIDNGMFDRLYAPRNAQVTGEINIHELGIEPSGRILFANTLYSCLATLSPTHAFKPLWKPKFISRLAPEDRCHLNGVAMEDGRAHYVTCCSSTDSVESWRGGRRDGGVLIDIEMDAIVAEGLSMPHSPRVIGEAIYFLESGRGALVRFDRATGRREDVTFCPGFARGLAFVGHYAVLTISLPRLAGFEGLAVAEQMRARGATPWRGLLIVDLRNGDIVEWLRLEGDVTKLFDVGVIEKRGLGPMRRNWPRRCAGRVKKNGFLAALYQKFRLALERGRRSVGIIRNLIDRRRVWRSLRDYPVYSPLFHYAEIVLTRDQINANYDYFLQQKAARLDYLAKYLAAFSVDLRLTREALPALDHWLYRYGGHLIPGGGEVIAALADYEPAWVGAYHGLNIVNDIAIFAGDYIISKNKDARWDVWYGDGTKYDYEKEGFGQPCLFGLRHFGYGKPHSMLKTIFRCCNAGFFRLMQGKSAVDSWDKPGEFVRVLDHLSNRNPPRPIPISQRTIDD